MKLHQASLKNPIQPIVFEPGKNDYRIAGVKMQSNDIQSTLKDIEQVYTHIFPAYLFEYHFSTIQSRSFIPGSNSFRSCLLYLQ